MPMHLYDGDNWSVHPDMATAEAGARVSIEAARDVAKFDREWPEWVEQIAVHEGPADAEEPGALPCALKAVAVNVKTPSSALDEEGYDDENEWWESADASRCDFDLVAAGSEMK